MLIEPVKAFRFFGKLPPLQFELYTKRIKITRGKFLKKYTFIEFLKGML